MFFFQLIPRDYNDKAHNLCVGGQNKRVQMALGVQGV